MNDEAFLQLTSRS